MADLGKLGRDVSQGSIVTLVDLDGGLSVCRDPDRSLPWCGTTFVMLQSVFVVGLRLLAQKMGDPYGTDLEDLSIMTYIYDGIDISNVIMSTNLVD